MTIYEIALEEETRLGMTPLEDYEYQDDHYSDGMTMTELTSRVADLQFELLGEIVELDPPQRRSYLSAIFAHILQWKDI